MFASIPSAAFSPSDLIASLLSDSDAWQQLTEGHALDHIQVAIWGVLIIAFIILTSLPIRAGILIRAVFYFAFVALVLGLISAEFKLLANHFWFDGITSLKHMPFVNVLIGVALTALIQKNSVANSLAIVLIQQGIFPPETAIPLLMATNFRLSPKKP